MKHLDLDELMANEQECLAHCNNKLNVFYSYFYAHQSVLEADREQRNLAAV